MTRPRGRPRKSTIPVRDLPARTIRASAETWSAFDAVDAPTQAARLEALLRETGRIDTD